MPSRSYRNNNPGNLKYGAFAARTGAFDQDPGGYARYPDAVTGVTAMVRLLAGASYKNLTIAEAIHRYAPPSDDNHTRAYIDYICDRSGAKSHQKIRELDPFTFLRLVAFMIRFEGWQA